VVYIANIVLAIPTAFGIFGSTQLAVFRGAADFLQGDSFTLTTANNYGGIWQTFFSKTYNTQLPSTTGSPTIAEALAS
jgi:succinate-acetate transporter protein